MSAIRDAQTAQERMIQAYLEGKAGKHGLEVYGRYCKLLAQRKHITQTRANAIERVTRATEAEQATRTAWGRAAADKELTGASIQAGLEDAMLTAIRDGVTAQQLVDTLTADLTAIQTDVAIAASDLDGLLTDIELRDRGNLMAETIETIGRIGETFADLEVRARGIGAQHVLSILHSAEIHVNAHNAWHHLQFQGAEARKRSAEIGEPLRQLRAMVKADAQ